eukprot:3012436-Prymnesium_polylepis.1
MQQSSQRRARCVSFTAPHHCGTGNRPGGPRPPAARATRQGRGNSVQRTIGNYFSSEAPASGS